MTETVVLVPGIGLGGVELAFLAFYLRKNGYRVKTFWTNPWKGTLNAKAKALQEMLTAQQVERPSFVTHSFGGPIVLQLLKDYPRQIGRIVMLGAPLLRCGAALRVLRVPGGKWVIGEAVASSVSQAHLPIPAGSEVGGIAGRFNFLLGFFLCPHKPNDTIVRVEETKHPDLTAHCVLCVSHTSMLASRNVSVHVTRFLETGGFSPPTGHK